MKWVIDASVAAKWLAPESDSAKAENLQDQELHAPDLLYAETANILWKKQVRRELDSATADAAARWLLQFPLNIHGSETLMLPALMLAKRLQHPAYDCFYLALADRTGHPMITADRRLFERCQRPDVPDLKGLVVLLSATGPAGTH